MSKNIRIIYLYLVCLIMLFLIVGGFIYTFYSFSEFLFPTTYSAAGTYMYDNVKTDNLKASISSLATFVVSGLIFTYYWRKIEKERKEMEE